MRLTFRSKYGGVIDLLPRRLDWGVKHRGTLLTKRHLVTLIHTIRHGTLNKLLIVTVNRSAVVHIIISCEVCGCEVLNRQWWVHWGATLTTNLMVHIRCTCQGVHILIYVHSAYENIRKDQE
jgi:hypothetical protein